MNPMTAQVGALEISSSTTMPAEAQTASRTSRTRSRSSGSIGTGLPSSRRTSAQSAAVQKTASGVSGVEGTGYSPHGRVVTEKGTTAELTELPDLAALETAVSQARAKLSTMRKERAPAAYDLTEVMHFFSFVHGMLACAADVREIITRLDAMEHE